eukprot:COSAG01_NODE_9594_length_2398_cov_1.685515_4_plen_52_part_01
MLVILLVRKRDMAEITRTSSEGRRRAVVLSLRLPPCVSLSLCLIGMSPELQI